MPWAGARLRVEALESVYRTSEWTGIVDRSRSMSNRDGKWGAHMKLGLLKVSRVLDEG
jgi:hypothetical protein